MHSPNGELVIELGLEPPSLGTDECLLLDTMAHLQVCRIATVAALNGMSMVAVLQFMLKLMPLHMPHDMESQLRVRTSIVLIYLVTDALSSLSMPESPESFTNETTE